MKWAYTFIIRIAVTVKCFVKLKIFRIFRNYLFIPQSNTLWAQLPLSLLVDFNYILCWSGIMYTHRDNSSCQPSGYPLVLSAHIILFFLLYRRSSLRCSVMPIVRWRWRCMRQQHPWHLTHYGILRLWLITWIILSK